MSLISFVLLLCSLHPSVNGAYTLPMWEIYTRSESRLKISDFKREPTTIGSELASDKTTVVDLSKAPKRKIPLPSDQPAKPTALPAYIPAREPRTPKEPVISTDRFSPQLNLEASVKAPLQKAEVVNKENEEMIQLNLESAEEVKVVNGEDNIGKKDVEVKEPSEKKVESVLAKNYVYSQDEPSLPLPNDESSKKKSKVDQKRSAENEQQLIQDLIEQSAFIDRVRLECQQSGNFRATLRWLEDYVNPKPKESPKPEQAQEKPEEPKADEAEEKIDLKDEIKPGELKRVDALNAEHKVVKEDEELKSEVVKTEVKIDIKKGIKPEEPKSVDTANAKHMVVTDDEEPNPDEHKDEENNDLKQEIKSEDPKPADMPNADHKVEEPKPDEHRAEEKIDLKEEIKPEEPKPIDLAAILREVGKRHVITKEEHHEDVTLNPEDPGQDQMPINVTGGLLDDKTGAGLFLIDIPAPVMPNVESGVAFIEIKEEHKDKNGGLPDDKTDKEEVSLDMTGLCRIKIPAVLGKPIAAPEASMIVFKEIHRPKEIFEKRTEEGKVLVESASSSSEEEQSRISAPERKRESKTGLEIWTEWDQNAQAFGAFEPKDPEKPKAEDRKPMAYPVIAPRVAASRPAERLDTTQRIEPRFQPLFEEKKEQKPDFRKETLKPEDPAKPKEEGRKLSAPMAPPANKRHPVFSCGYKTRTESDQDEQALVTVKPKDQVIPRMRGLEPSAPMPPFNDEQHGAAGKQGERPDSTQRIGSLENKDQRPDLRKAARSNTAELDSQPTIGPKQSSSTGGSSSSSSSSRSPRIITITTRGPRVTTVTQKKTVQVKKVTAKKKTPAWIAWTAISLVIILLIVPIPLTYYMIVLHRRRSLAL